MTFKSTSAALLQIRKFKIKINNFSQYVNSRNLRIFEYIFTVRTIKTQTSTKTGQQEN